MSPRTRLSTKLLVVVAISFFALPLGLSGKRVPPKPVSPVVYNGVEYSARGDGKIGYVAATDITTGKQLWTVEVFRIHTHFWKEEDNQWIFISDLQLVQGALLVKDERSHCYRLDLASRRVRREPCG
jgi:hypothetical protein